VVAAAAIAAAVLLMPRQLLFGAKSVAPAAGAPSPVADAAASAVTASSGVAGGTEAAGAAPSAAAPSAAAPPTSSPAARGVSSPSVGSEAAADAAAGPETREVTPFEPPALGLPGREVARNALAALRRPSHRPTAGELQQIVDTTGAAAAREPGRREPLMAAQAWARGGLAYLEGRGGEASERRRELAGMTAAWGIAWPAATFNGSTAWDVAALYADPRRELDTLLQPELRGVGGNLRPALAAAYSAHLDGNHSAALRLLLDDAKIDPSASDATRRALAAQFLVAEAIEAHDEPAARRWLPDALDGGRAPLARGFLIEMMALATETNGPLAAAALKNEACRLVPGYCGALARPRDQPVQRPMNQDRLGRRRPFGGQPAPQPRPTGG